MREPCPDCGSTEGVRVDRAGQACILCAVCDRWVYNAPKAETGEPQRSVRSRPEIKSSQRSRLLARDGFCCVCCGRHGPEFNLHIGHFLSVDDGRKVGATDEELWDDENLAVMCEECNLGMGRATFSLRLMHLVLRARIALKAQHG